MIIIAGTVDMEPDKREAALAEAAPKIDAARKQKGCLSYDWNFDPVLVNRVHVYECWETQADLAAHLAGPHYRAMLATLGSYGLRDTVVNKFRVDRKEPVYDKTGTARADFSDEVG